MQPSCPRSRTKRRKGRSIVVLAKQKGVGGRTLQDLPHAAFVPFTAQTRMSGVDLGPVQYRKGAAESVKTYVGGKFPAEMDRKIDEISKLGGTPLVVATRDTSTPSDAPTIYGVIYLKDIVKGGLADRFARFRAMGIRTVMITGDNKLTASAIAAEAGVDDFLAQATPEDKLALIRKEQTGRTPGRHDGRWDQRCPGPGPGGRRSCHEHRHAGGQGGGKHGGSGLQSHQAD